MKYSELNENKKHGETDFPIQYYRVFEDYYQYIMPLHWHKEFEILRVLSGELELYINNVRYSMIAGDIAFIGCGMLHRGDPKDCVYECLVFDMNMLFGRVGDRNSALLLPLADGRVAAECVASHGQSNTGSDIRELFSLMRDRPEYYELSVVGLLLRVFYCLYSEDRVHEISKTRHGHRYEMMTELVKWLETHYTEQVSLSVLARHVGVNEKYLCRVFREMTGKSPIEYVNGVRIEAACHKMTAENMTVTEAALDSGFNDLSYFSRAFKKYMGVSPLKYRMALKENK